MKINPHSKNLEAIQSIIPNIKEKEIDSVLNKFKILIKIPSTNNMTSNDQEIILVLLNLLPRMFERVYIINGKQFIREFPNSHQTKIKNVSNLKNPDLEIVVGNAEYVKTEKQIFVSSSGWSAYISHKEPCKFSSLILNSIGSMLAGGLCVGEIFKIAFQNYLNITINDTTKYDPLTHGAAKQPVISPDLTKPIKIRDLTMVGLGGVGQAVLYCLRKLPVEFKTLNLVDNEKTDESNEQRYMLSYKENRLQPKSNIAIGNIINRIKIQNPNFFLMTYEDFMMRYGLFRPRFSNVVVTVDNVDTRKNVQAGLPKRIINGWTETDNQNLAYGISIHKFIDDYQCLACAHYPEKAPADQIEFYSLRTGFSVEEVKRYIEEQIPLTERDIARISESMNIDQNKIEQHIGKQLEDVIHGQCGTFTVPLKETQATAPVPHIPLLVAIHIVTQIIVPYLKITRKIRMIESSAVFFGLKYPNINCLEIRKKNENCFCNDEIYQKVYKDKWKIS